MTIYLFTVIYSALRIILHNESERTGYSEILLRKQRILLSLATIPAWTIYYAYRVMRYIQTMPPPPDFAGLPPLPVPFYIAGLAWLVIDVLWQFRKLQHEIIRGPIIDGTADSFQNRW
ncbi:MAG: hypothetical protein RTU09_03115 [Candidatus Thorarchaeota archaeon]